MKKKISAEIVADSINQQGHRITTFLLTFPRFILAELNTHRLFSKNSASSRAIPFDKMVKMVEEDPFIPIAWQKDHKGMQGTEYFDPNQSFRVEDFLKSLKTLSDKIDVTLYHKIIGKYSDLSMTLPEWWLFTRDKVLEASMLLNVFGVTKQICNRLLEPFMWHTILLTSTEYENFFELRCPKYPLGDTIYKSKLDCMTANQLNGTKFGTSNEHLPKEMDQFSLIEWLLLSKSGAEIHIQALAEAMWDAMNESTPKYLKAGEWHIPFGDKIINVDFDYTKTREQDIEFHKNRLMFIVKDGELKFALKGCKQSHTEFFGNVSGIIRGFELDGCVYTYKDNFIPIESKEVKEYFKEFKLYAGAKDFLHYPYGENHLLKVSTARCARLSYMTFDGEIDYQKDITLHDRLLESHHMSPFEHCARAMTNVEYGNFIKGVGHPATMSAALTFNDEAEGWCNNFRGFIQYRYLIENK